MNVADRQTHLHTDRHRMGALKMTDRKMTDRDIAGGGKCRTGIRRTKVQGWKMTDKSLD